MMRLFNLLYFFALLNMIYPESTKAQDASVFLNKASRFNKKIKSGEYHLVSKFKFFDTNDTTILNDIDVTFKYLPTITLATVNDGKSIIIYDTSLYKKILNLTDSSLLTNLRNSPETDNKIFDYLRPYFMFNLPKGNHHWEVAALNDSVVTLINTYIVDTAILETYSKLYINTRSWITFRFEEYIKLITPNLDTVAQYQDQYIYNTKLFSYYKKEYENKFDYKTFFEPKKIIQAAGFRETKINNDFINDSLRFANIKTVTGTNIDFASLSSNIIILDFYYLACYPCMLSLPVLNKVQQKYSEKQVKIIGINAYDKSEERIKNLLTKNKIIYPHCIDQYGLTGKLNVRAFPTLIILDKNKSLIKTIDGYSKSLESDLDEIIRKAND